MPQPLPLIARADIPAALGLLTRIPVPVDGARAAARGAAAAWAWPVAGLAVAALAALGAGGALAAGLAPAVAAGVALAVQAAATGAMHEDGLADSIDGLWGGATRDRRLEIMKDSRTGSYGVIALILSFGLRWSALAAILAQPGWGGALLAVAALSRAGMAALASALPPARPGGLGARVGRPAPATTATAIGLAALAAILAAGPGAAGAALAMAGALTLWALIARARIGGQTGDILGAGQQIAETAGLLLLAAAAGG
ncbi:MAG: adenosylcobinamide-GDP ribazoletransferase [Rubellimicrobium sp.]|nr:adenosylcobinamide-GDP ribazoletransferase [Rubellimicrobium sp.]